jgi:hypothetical protein
VSHTQSPVIQPVMQTVDEQAPITAAYSFYQAQVYASLPFPLTNSSSSSLFQLIIDANER